MRNRYGITEGFWNNLPEDKKISWKLATWTTAFVASILISKTGIRILDWLIVGFSTLTALLVIESQRNLRRYKSPILRKRILRATIMLGVSGATLLGVATFSSISYVIAKVMFADYLGQTEKSVPLSRPEGIIAVLCIMVAIFVALFRSFRQLQMEQVFYAVPLSALKRLLLTRTFIADSFPPFAFFELSVVVFSYFYCSSVAQIAQTLIDSAKL